MGSISSPVRHREEDYRDLSGQKVWNSLSLSLSLCLAHSLVIVSSSLFCSNLCLFLLYLYWVNVCETLDETELWFGSFFHPLLGSYFHPLSVTFIYCFELPLID